ncbi:splicing regulator SDE2 [Stomoxys calcitrans]|uniref:splicing regulator SDE2 n=1 Tax=Stomoxys calcitrans TaxID=35570 RepID=UPI0027E22292|nr:splicing regulator SDE2 [Stomoxys calcitrans]
MESLAITYQDLISYLIKTKSLVPESFYLEQNGKRLQSDPTEDVPVYIRFRLLGGKGGFGSMLRAIGAQIEKTTNREACRDLSGRRLRDINEEKRLKAWLDKQGEREREAEERKKRKIEKLLAVPKHEFKDKEYEEARSKLTEKVCDAVEEGFKKAATSGPKDNLKRKHEPSTSQQAAAKAKAKKPALWIDDDLSGDSEDSSDDGDNNSHKVPKKRNESNPPVSSDANEKPATTTETSPGEETTSSSDSESLSVVSK